MNDPELNKNNREDSGEGFVRERIINKPSRKRALKKILLAGVCGILFGLAAGITLAAVFPAASHWFAEEETEPSISIPKDTPETTGAEAAGEAVTDGETGASAEGETDITESESEETTEAPSEDPGMTDDEIEALIRDMITASYEEYSSDPDWIKDMYQAMALLGRDYNAAVVTVVMKDVGTDWFENEVETSGECAGIIWNEADDGSLYILSGGVIPEAGTGMQVIFNDGSRCDAVFCQADAETGLMVLKVDAQNVDEALRAKIRVLPLGNSYSITKGLPLLVIGNPIGEVGAVIPALVTYTDGNFAGADSIYRKLYLDCSTREGTNSFVVSMEGEILGIITPDTSGSVTSMIGISDLKGVIELLANGEKVPYLGILGQTVTEELQTTYSLPYGVYVNEVIVDSPVYKAGIKAGDVIAKINGTEVSTIRGMKNVVEGLDTQMEVTVTVMRAGNGEYQALEFVIMPGLR